MEEGTHMTRKFKRDYYAEQGIEYKDGRIYAPALQAWIRPLLKDPDNNRKTQVWTLSTLPTDGTFDVTIDGRPYTVRGTCPCHCPGCYAMHGLQATPSARASQATTTLLVRLDVDFVRRALIAQIRADHITEARIHAAGDFDNNPAYVAALIDAATETGCDMWTYTKWTELENAADGVPLFHIVPSIVPGHGLNYGTCEHVMECVDAIKAAGRSVYVCRCGVDPDQHCKNCGGCRRYDHVLFIEHGTDYDKNADPLFPVLAAYIESQESVEM